MKFELIIFIFCKLCKCDVHFNCFVCYAYCVGICEYLGVLATVQAIKGVLNVLSLFINRSLRKVKVQEVVVVKFEMYNSSVNVLK